MCPPLCLPTLAALCVSAARRLQPSGSGVPGTAVVGATCTQASTAPLPAAAERTRAAGPTHSRLRAEHCHCVWLHVAYRIVQRTPRVGAKTSQASVSGVGVTAHHCAARPSAQHRARRGAVVAVAARRRCSVVLLEGGQQGSQVVHIVLCHGAWREGETESWAGGGKGNLWVEPSSRQTPCHGMPAPPMPTTARTVLDYSHTIPPGPAV